MIIDKRRVKMEGKRKKVMECFVNALIENNVKEKELILKTKTKGFWSVITALFPAGLKEIALNMVTASEYELCAVNILLDEPGEIISEEYRDFWINTLKKDKLHTKDVTSEVIENHNVLIYQLLLRMCVDAMCINMNEDKDGLVLVQTIHTFVSNLKKDPELLGNGYIYKTAIALATEHETWVGWIGEIVEAVKTIHANLETVKNLRIYLSAMKLTLSRQLLSELTTQENVKQLSTEHFHHDVLKNNLVDLEQQCIEISDKAERKKSKDRAVANKKLAMERASHLHSYTNPADDYLLSFRERANKVIRSIEPEKKSVLKTEMSKVDNVTQLYDLIDETRIIEDIIRQLNLLNKTTGWIAIMLGIIKLDAVANVIREYAKKSISILMVDAEASVFDKYPDIAISLISSDSTSGNRLESAGISVASQLQNLQSKECMIKIARLIREPVERLRDIQKILPGNVQLIDNKVCEDFFNNPVFSTSSKTRAVGNPFENEQDIPLEDMAEKSNLPAAGSDILFFDRRQSVSRTEGYRLNTDAYFHGFLNRSYQTANSWEAPCCSSSSTPNGISMLKEAFKDSEKLFGEKLKEKVVEIYKIMDMVIEGNAQVDQQLVDKLSKHCEEIKNQFPGLFEITNNQANHLRSVTQ